MYFPRPVAWFVLCIALAASAGGWFIAWKHAESGAQKQFDEETGRIITALTERMKIYEDVLHGAAGLYAASYSVERSEWRSYLESVSIERRFPGIDGVGFIAWVPHGSLAEFLRITREDKTPDFTLKEADTNSDLMIVKYLEPESRHRAMLGRDISVDLVQRAVAEKARDTGNPILSGVVTLRDDVRDPAPGCLMLLPVYQHGPTQQTPGARRSALQGWVFARFLIGELMREVLIDKHPGVHLRIHDANAWEADNLIFDNDPELTAQRPLEAAWINHDQRVRFGGRSWILNFWTKPSFEAARRHGASVWVAGAGILISLLLFGIAWSLSHTRERALAMAADMTQTLRTTNDRLQLEIGERERAQRRTTTQHAVTRVLAEAATLPAATSKIVQAICESLGWEVGALWQVNSLTNQLHCVEFWHQQDFDASEFEMDSRGRTFLKGEGLPGRVWANAKPLWIQDVIDDKAFLRMTFAAKAGLHGAFGFPILLGNELLGVIEFFSCQRFEPEEGLVNMMTAAGSQIGQFIERKRSEEALRHSEAIYHSLVESLPLSIVREDLQGRLIFANTRYCVNLGKTLEELLGKTDAGLFPPELAARQRQAVRRVLETGSTLETVEERLEPDGAVRYVQVIRTPVYEGERVMIGLLGIFWDVTDKHRAESELRHERFLLRTLMDNVPERIYFKDAQSRFLRNNRAHLQVFGLTRPEEAIGKSDFDFFSEQHARQAYEDEQRLMADGKAVTKEEKETWPDGSETWVISTKMPLRDEDGQTVGTFGISRDITDRKRAEEGMRQAKEAAEEANRTKSHFLASMSHELRTPLNSVIGFANILLKNKAGTLGPAELNFLDRIQANGRHLLSLINQILDLSKIEARKIELQTGPVALDALVRETLAQQEGLVRDKHVQLLADLPPLMAPLVTDAEKLRQVIINLIGNALKFTDQGSVTVRVAADPSGHRPIRIDVIDTGIGIPADKLTVIFEAFQQAEVGTARKYGGTGLGLTISQALCELMGYHITVSSEPGRGSIFTIHLGTASKVAGSPPPVQTFDSTAPLEIPRRLAGKRVLVIDDELDSRTLLTHTIQEFGCQAISSASGEEGLRMAREFHPDLISVDLMMPGLDGWQVIAALKADLALCHIPVVVVSIVAGENKGGVLGAVEVLQKPVNRSDLLAVLHRCLPIKNPRILVVDDEEDARRVLVSHLEEEPCELRLATSGHEALEILKNHTPDLVLLDLMMPVMDGMAFLNHLRSNPRLQFLPVVIVTAKELSVAESDQLRRMTQDIVKKGDVFEADLKRVLHRFLSAGVASATKPEPP